MKAIYDLLAKEMMASSLRITNSYSDSEDILQEGFMDAFQKIGQLKDDTKFVGWLKRMIINKSLRLIEKRRNFVPVVEIEHIPEEIESDNWYEGVPFSTIQAAIQELPDGCREIFSLYLLEGYQHKEVADLLGIALSTSKSQYRYALRLLREKLIPIHE